MSSSDQQWTVFYHDDCKLLSQLDSLEFGAFKSEAPDFIERKKLLEKAVQYFDSIIAHTVLEIEKDRTTEESEALTEVEFSDREEDLSTIRCRIYEEYTERFNTLIDSKIYLYLGHYQLLLSRFDDALSAYLKYESLCGTDASKNCSFLYGLGLCTFRFNAFKRFHLAHLFEVWSKPKQAKLEYLQLLDSDLAAPAHIRHLCLRQLAWLYHTGVCGPKSDSGTDKDLDIQWLQSALELDNTNGKTWYLLGRCQAALNRVQEAFAAYRSSIDKTEASADTWCSIGVLYQEQSQPTDALQAYFCAVQLDKCHVAAWANLGTLYESMQQYKEALKCYKNAVNADKNNELKPELRSHLAVLQQLIPHLPEKRVNGGAHGSNSSHGTQAPANASGGMLGASGAANDGTVTKLPTVDEAWSLPIPAELTQRQMQLVLQEAAASGDDSCFGGLRDDKDLSGILLATPLASILRRKDGRHHSVSSGDNVKSVSTNSTELTADRPRRNSSPDTIPLTSQQLQMLQALQTQETSLSASQRQLLTKLQHQGLRYHQYRLNQLRRLGHTEPVGDYREENPSEPAESGTRSRPDTGCAEAVGNGNPSSVTGTEGTVDLFPTEDDDLPHVVGSPNGDHLPEEDLAFLTDDFLAQLNRSEAAANLDLVEFALFSNAEQQRPSSNNNNTNNTNTTNSNNNTNGSNTDNPRSSDSRSVGSITQGDSARDPSSRSGHANEARGQPTRPESSMDCSTDVAAPSSPIGGTDTLGSSVVVRPTNVEPVDLYAYLTRPLLTPTSLTAGLHINMSASQILNSVRGLGRSGGPWWPSILPEGSPIPAPPAKPYPPPAKDKLLPPTPSVYLESRKDAHSPDLMRYCFSQPAVVIRGLAAALRLDLGLFSTKSLVEANPDHRIEVRTQLFQLPDVNRDSQGQNMWFCESSRAVTTIAKFATYQARSFVEAVHDEKFPLLHNSPNQSGVAHNQQPQQGHHSFQTGLTENGPTSLGSVTPVRKDSSSATPDPGFPGNQRPGSGQSALHSPMVIGDEHRSSFARPDHTTQSGGKSAKVTTPGKPKFIRFGTNCDLSDEKKWFPQLHELTKLPTFTRVVSAFNMLSHMGYSLLGMNTVQLYLKVPGARTPGHQENNCFCSVNINIGPGDCEWFSVPEQYWGAIHDLCERNKVDYLTGSWWPNLETLYNEEIPVYRFIQRPGDLVWINSGTVHWVQAIGWCNNIAWNVGPLTCRQYEMAVQRYEFNRLRGYKSIVPMIHFSWQLAKNVKISDPGMFELIKQTLLRSLVQSQLAVDFIEKLGLPIKRHGKQPDDVAHSCHDCEIEVFNLLFVIAQEKKLVVRCLDCARRIDPSLRTFTILAEYYMNELAEIYDDFHLQTQPLTAYTVGKS